LGSTKLEDFKDFVFNILCWLKTNGMLGAASSKWQLTFLGTHLNSKAQEWYMWNIELPTWVIQCWSLETAVLSLQHRFLLKLMHRHTAADFYTVCQGNSTVQELYNQMNKLAEHIVHLPDAYTIRQRFWRPYSLQLAQKCSSLATMPSNITSSSYIQLQSSWMGQNCILVYITRPLYKTEHLLQLQTCTWSHLEILPVVLVLQEVLQSEKLWCMCLADQIEYTG
jgi:hypothetical protein